MDFQLKIKTPGTRLSTHSFFWLMSDVRKIFEQGTIEGLVETIPRASKTSVTKAVKGKIDFYISDIRKGSWEIALLGAVGGIIGKVIYDLGIDIVKNHPSYEKLKERINGNHSDLVASKIQNRFQNRHNLGPFQIEKHKISILTKSDGTKLVEYECELSRRDDSIPAITTEEQLKELIEHIKTNRKTCSNRMAGD